MTREDLQKFCCEARDERPTLELPWREGDHVYASNGRIILRVPLTEFPNIAERKHAPKMDSWDFGAIKLWEDWLAIPADVPEPTNELCKICGGSGAHFCEDCESNHDCCKCKGSGSRPVIWTIRFGGGMIDSRPLKLLQTLPGALIQNKAGEPGSPRFFKFDGGEGFIATMKEGNV